MVIDNRNSRPIAILRIALNTRLTSLTKMLIYSADLTLQIPAQIGLSHSITNVSLTEGKIYHILSL